MSRPIFEYPSRTVPFVLTMAALALSACSNDRNANATDGGTSTTDDAGRVVADGGATDTDAGETAADAGTVTGELRNTGFIGLLQLRQDGAWLKDAYAGFLSVPSAATDHCTEHAVEGSCVLSACTEPTVGHDTDFDVKSAGRVRIAGGPIDVSLEPGGDDPYHRQDMGASPWWTAPVDLTVTAEGGDVPAFTATMRTPSSVVLTQPEPPVGTTVDDSGAEVRYLTLELDSSRDLPLAWTADGSTGTLVFVIKQRLSAVSTQTIRCEMDVAALSGTVPASLVGRLDTNLEGSFYAETSTKQEIRSGDWPVQLTAVTPAHNAAGVDASGGVVFAADD